jgi:hypothetical protein
MAEAVNYALGQWEELSVFTTDGAVPIDNNAALRGGTFAACRSFGTKEFSLCWLGCWRRARRGHLQLDRHSETEQSQPRSVLAERAVSHRGASDQPHRRTAAVESRRRIS